MKIEVFRAIIPANKLINDNHGQHYRILSGRTKWLANKAMSVIEGREDFVVPDKDTVRQLLDDGQKFGLILEHWKCQRSFDPQNYGMTFKPIIDVFSKLGYWEDDSWLHLYPVIFSGGDHSVWNERAIRFDNDGLPDSIKKDWWIDKGANQKIDSFIRIIAFPKADIINIKGGMT